MIRSRGLGCGVGKRGIGQTRVMHTLSVTHQYCRVVVSITGCNVVLLANPFAVKIHKAIDVS